MRKIWKYFVTSIVFCSAVVTLVVGFVTLIPHLDTVFGLSFGPLDRVTDWAATYGQVGVGVFLGSLLVMAPAFRLYRNAQSQIEASQSAAARATGEVFSRDHDVSHDTRNSVGRDFIVHHEEYLANRYCVYNSWRGDLKKVANANAAIASAMNQDTCSLSIKLFGSDGKPSILIRDDRSEVLRRKEKFDRSKVNTCIERLLAMPPEKRRCELCNNICLLYTSPSPRDA